MRRRLSPVRDRRARRLAREAGLAVHLDGARLANALVSTGATPAEMTWRAGVDVLSFGATKNGGARLRSHHPVRRRAPTHRRSDGARQAGRPHAAEDAFPRRADGAYLKDGLWLNLARHANTSATRLAAGLNCAPARELAHPVDGNEVFAMPARGAATSVSTKPAPPFIRGSMARTASSARGPPSHREIEALAAALPESAIFDLYRA